jgi:hypothetical protein
MATQGDVEKLINLLSRGDNNGASAMMADPNNGFTKSDYVKVTSSLNKKGPSVIKSDGGGGIGADIVSTIQGILASQSEKLYSKYEGEFVQIEDLLSIGFDKATNKFKSFGEILKGVVKTTVKQINIDFTQQSDLLTEINTKTGLTGRLSKEFRKEITETTVNAERLGISFEEVAGAMSKILVDAGRFKIMSSETMDKVVLMSKVGFDNMTDAAAAVSEFQKVSMGASDAMEVVDKTVTSSLQLGLNAKVTTKDIGTNLAKLNTYGFKEGVDGLRKMVQQAQSLKLDLNESFKLADKVMDPTSALSLSANLQVIGGALGDFNDPIKLMWMATNNVEGLQDALVGSLESLTSFDEKSGTFKIVGADLRRARAMADEFGMSLQDASNLAIQAAQRTSAATDLMSTGLVFEDEDDKEFLTNLAQMKGGKMVIEIPGDLQESLGKQDIALGEMTSDQKNQLLLFREDFKKMSATDIAEEQVNVIKNMNRNLTFLAAKARVGMGKLGNDLVQRMGFDPIKFVAETKEYADKVASGIVKFQDGASEIFDQYLPKNKSNVSNNASSVNAPLSPTQSQQSLPPVTTTEKKEIVVNHKFTSDMSSSQIAFAAEVAYNTRNPQKNDYLNGGDYG